ncbi:hypothetical protein [Chitiniphilus eburneus]|uniref:Uncharacterized protein n=1 Tax=Chitiniphilus eburneus TaxID=2571148 RepID=A0A4U0Q229_9NEIS|nr:hypothetical protein [Chitiniphilus eburneus]TJZ69744.1 hypothetical protein FAZ21_14595 [Chitiniphilus eburneus]
MPRILVLGGVQATRAHVRGVAQTVLLGNPRFTGVRRLAFSGESAVLRFHQGQCVAQIQGAGQALAFGDADPGGVVGKPYSLPFGSVVVGPVREHTQATAGPFAKGAAYCTSDWLVDQTPINNAYQQYVPLSAASSMTRGLIHLHTEDRSTQFAISTAGIVTADGEVVQLPQTFFEAPNYYYALSAVWGTAADGTPVQAAIAVGNNIFGAASVSLASADGAKALIPVLSYPGPGFMVLGHCMQRGVHTLGVALQQGTSTTTSLQSRSTQRYPQTDVNGMIATLEVHTDSSSMSADGTLLGRICRSVVPHGDLTGTQFTIAEMPPYILSAVDAIKGVVSDFLPPDGFEDTPALVAERDAWVADAQAAIAGTPATVSVNSCSLPPAVFAFADSTWMPQAPQHTPLRWVTQLAYPLTIANHTYGVSYGAPTSVVQDLLDADRQLIFAGVCYGLASLLPDGDFAGVTLWTSGAPRGAQIPTPLIEPPRFALVPDDQANTALDRMQHANVLVTRYGATWEPSLYMVVPASEWENDYPRAYYPFNPWAQQLICRQRIDDGWYCTALLIGNRLSKWSSPADIGCHGFLLDTDGAMKPLKMQLSNADGVHDAWVLGQFTSPAGETLLVVTPPYQQPAGFPAPLLLAARPFMALPDTGPHALSGLPLRSVGGFGELDITTINWIHHVWA